MLKVRVSQQELTAIRGKAARLRVSPQRLLVECALESNGGSATERRALFEELMAVRRLMAALGNNVNQVTRIASTTGDGLALDALVAMITRVLTRTDAMLTTLRTPSA